jgi:Flp pilus assembly protein TadG
MRFGFESKTKRGIRAEHGSIAVEFAIIFPILMLLVFGVIDFGHAGRRPLWHPVSNRNRQF